MAENTNDDDAVIRLTDRGFAANTAAIISESLSSPSTSSYIISRESTGGTAAWSPAPPPGAKPRKLRLKDVRDRLGTPGPKEKRVFVHPAFKMTFIAVLALTVVAGLAEVIMAAAWGTPTANQQTAFQAADFAWKAGVGAIFGLLGGKQT